MKREFIDVEAQLTCRDYRGAIDAGLEARLLRRDGEYSDGAIRHDGEDLKGVHTVKSLTEVLEEARRRNA